MAIISDNYLGLNGRFVDRTRPNEVIDDSFGDMDQSNFLLCLKPTSTIYDRDKYRKITGMRFRLHTFADVSDGTKIRAFYGYGVDIDINSVTWNTRPNPASASMHQCGETDQIVEGYTFIPVSNDSLQVAAYSYRGKNAFVIEGGITAVRAYKGASLYYDYDDAVVRGITVSNRRPVAGSSFQGSNRILFEWDTDWDDTPSFELPEPISSKIEWRVLGSEEIHSYAKTDSFASPWIYVPEGTFPVGEIEWRNVLETNAGQVLRTDWVEITITDGIAVATPISPNNETIDAAKDFELRWNHSSGTGSEQTKFDIQMSSDKINWRDYATEETSRTSCTVLGDTLPSGVHYWRVRSYNAEMAAGEWSEPAMFIAISAPEAPAISIVSTSPIWSIRWGATGQHAFEVSVDGRVIASVFSVSTTYKAAETYSDGVYRIGVRIQNQYSLWSDWSYIDIEVQNAPGSAVELSVASTTEPNATLIWTGGDFETFVVYRNGNVIGKTNERFFTDQYGIGKSVYYVRSVDEEEGNYSESNEVETEIDLRTPWLYSAKTKQWVPLKMSEKETNGLSQSYSITAAFLHFAGSHKPSVEYGVSSDRSMSFSVGFLNDSEDLQKFLAMVGGTVCAKWPDGDMIIGAMFNWERAHGRIYTEFSTKIIETEFDEVAENG